MEAMKTHKINPHFTIGESKIPTWTTPLVLVCFISFVVPNTSFLGHLCGLLFGYGCKSLFKKMEEFIADYNRGFGISQIPCTSRVDTQVD